MFKRANEADTLSAAAWVRNVRRLVMGVLPGSGVLYPWYNASSAASEVTRRAVYNNFPGTRQYGQSFVQSGCFCRFDFASRTARSFVATSLTIKQVLG